MTDTINITATIPATIIVEKRDGSSIAVDMSRVHEDLLPDMIVEGVAEFLRDGTSTALADAYSLAHDGDAGDTESRKAWGGDNTEKVAEQSNALFVTGLEKLYSGERNTRSGGASQGFTEEQEAAYTLADFLRRQAGWKELAMTFAGMKGKSTGERKSAMLETIENLPKKKADDFAKRLAAFI